MKKEQFENVVIEVFEINHADIITTSPVEDETFGNESYVPTEKDEGFGEWV